MDQTPRILIVDDNPDAQELLTHVVEMMGYIPVNCFSGKEALIRVQEDTPALMLLDIMMPGMTGMDVLTQLLKADQTRRLPVIVITAVDMPDSIRELPNIAAVISKTHFDAGFLKLTIGQILNAPNPGTRLDASGGHG